MVFFLDRKKYCTSVCSIIVEIEAFQSIDIPHNSRTVKKIVSTETKMAIALDSSTENLIVNTVIWYGDMTLT